jgi:PAS domain S-box-containing protein
MRRILLWLVPAVLIVAYCVFDRPIAQAAIVIGMSSSATYVALRGGRARRGNRTYWLIVVALGLWAAGWIGWQGTILATGSVPATSSLDNLLFLGGDAALLLALVVALCRRERSLVGLLDVSTIAASLLVVAWASLLHKYTGGSLPKFGRGLQIAYGAFDVLLVAAGLRLLVAPRLRAGGGALLVGAAGALVASDFFWNWGTAFHIYVPGSWADAGWLIFAVLGALAARRCTQDVTAEVDGERQARHHTVGRVTLLGISALVCPLVFVVEVLVDGVDTGPLVVGGAVIALFVVAGFAVLLRQASTFHARAGEIASLVDSTADAVIGTTPNGVITSWNHGAELIYGWAGAEAVGRPLVMIVPPATRGLVAESMQRLAQGTTAIRHAATGLHRDGHEIHVDLTVCPVFASGRLIAVSTMARDISSQVRAEAERERLLDELAEQNEQLRQLDRLKDEFVASVSHELRTPLTSIRGFLELIRDDEVLDDEHDGMLAIVDRNAERLLGLVNDLLFAAQVAAGGQVKLALEQVDLADIVSEAAAASAPRAEIGGITLEVDAQTALLEGDPTRIAEVADNLISNAIKFTPPNGTVRVAVSSEGDTVLLTVADSGMGIADDEQAKLFSRFYRTEAAKSDAIPGTGLGLSIVKSIVSAHGGTVTFESAVGVGTTFVVALPCAPVAVLSPVA